MSSNDAPSLSSSFQEGKQQLGFTIPLGIMVRSHHHMDQRRPICISQGQIMSGAVQSEQYRQSVCFIYIYYLSKSEVHHCAEDTFNLCYVTLQSVTSAFTAKVLSNQSVCYQMPKRCLTGRLGGALRVGLFSSEARLSLNTQRAVV